MESSLSETLLLMPQNYLIIELVQAVYLHIPVLLCQQQCLHSGVLFLFFFRLPFHSCNSSVPINRVP